MAYSHAKVQHQHGMMDGCIINTKIIKFHVASLYTGKLGMNCFVTSQAPKINLPARQRLNQTRQKKLQEDLATISRKSGPILDHQKGYGVVNRGVICHGDCRGLPRLRPLKFDFIFVICCSVIGCTAFDSLYGKLLTQPYYGSKLMRKCPILISAQKTEVPSLKSTSDRNFNKADGKLSHELIHEWREMHIKGSGLNRTARKTVVKIYKRFHLVIVELQQQLKDDIAS
ncbi:hypothetical protein T02_7535 [Trichinella nativa]|uniref:Uncharacterized protein n=1 Tax=Trichinella nativa TaxID=6335 RepID=A0A0V1LPJ4_9BILA|nr:hypothetical protein T02_7535 [Trichinella nativa]